MGAFFYVVAIMGCGDGAAQCRDARLLPAQYATAAQCRAALPARLAENTDVPYPEISADCRPQGLQMARADGKPRG
jgi:hypothetical protein